MSRTANEIKRELEIINAELDALNIQRLELIERIEDTNTYRRALARELLALVEKPAKSAPVKKGESEP